MADFVQQKYIFLKKYASYHVDTEVAMTHDVLLICRLFHHRLEDVEQNTWAYTVLLKKM